MFRLNPQHEENLAFLNLNRAVASASGMYLTDTTGQSYLDFVAQCGAAPFGHNPDFLAERVREHFAEQRPTFTAPMLCPSTYTLAELLCSRAGNGFDRCVFTNSGAESTEVAIKLVRARTGRNRILSTTNSFHGKTFGAVCATGHAPYRDAFRIKSSDFAHIPFNDLDALGNALSTQDFAAFFVEPVQGEGGMIVADTGYLSAAQKLCEQNGTLLVVDEVQTGLGRTGYFLASEYFLVRPDIVLLAKALGGGLVAIGACLTRSDIWTKDFGLNHSSTFAGGGLSTAIGAAVVNKLTEDGEALLAGVRRTGTYLSEKLAELVQDFPTVFDSVSGMGLMQALHLRPQKAGAARIFNFVGAPLLSSYLLTRHQIATLVALNRTRSLRIEPPLIVSTEQIDRLIAALYECADLIASGRFDQLYVGLSHPQLRAARSA